MIWLGIGIVGIVAAGVIALIAYGLVTRDKYALSDITEFDRGRIPLHLLVDHKFNSRFRDAVVEAAEFWNTAIGTTWFVAPDVVGEGGSLIAIDPYNDDTNHGRAFAYTHLALTENKKGIAGASIRINTKRYDLHDLSITVLCNAIAHELGHTLGLAHDDISDSIMYGKARADGAMVMESDITFLREAYGERRQRRRPTEA